MGYASGGVLNGFDNCQSATRFAGGDPLNFRAGDTNVGQFTIGQVREFAPHRFRTASRHDIGERWK
jgi:hypothetical protein